jgi:hypothetical protein
LSKQLEKVPAGEAENSNPGKTPVLRPRDLWLGESDKNEDRGFFPIHLLHTGQVIPLND